jgi:hypothetical protein
MEEKDVWVVKMHERIMGLPSTCLLRLVGDFIAKEANLIDDKIILRLEV